MTMAKWYLSLVQRINQLEKEKERVEKSTVENSLPCRMTLTLGERQELARLKTELICVHRSVDEKRINLLTEKR